MKNTTINEKVSINRDQRLYVTKCGDGYSCLGFDVAERRRRAVLEWIGKSPNKMRVGTKKHWHAYFDTMMEGFVYHDKTGKRCNVELTPGLIGLEGKRVEVLNGNGEKTRFIVGKSTGWMPCHLAIKRADSTGGCAVYIPKNAKIRVVS